MSLLAVSEGSAYGAAILAMVGGGLYKSVEDACSKVIKVTKTVSPDPKDVEVYSKMFPLYRQSYKQLKETMHSLHNLTGS